MAERREGHPIGDEVPQELRRPEDPADYDESGGTGLEAQPGDDVIGGGVSGNDDDPIGAPGIPDEAGSDPVAGSGPEGR